MSSIYIQEPPTNGKVLLYTSCGEIEIELWSKETPKACRNFIQLCLESYYDETIFHRIVPGFVVQGGDPTGTGEGGESIYGEPFKDEYHQRLRFSHRGLVAMASSESCDNASQFFFTLDRADELNGRHTLFGKVVGPTVFNMLRLADREIGENDRPLEPPRIIKTEILANPFDDIVPRETSSLATATASDEFVKQSKSKATKNFSLLSFGDEAEEDDEESTALSTVQKIKSSHDVLTDDPKLSAEPAVDDTNLHEEASNEGRESRDGNRKRRFVSSIDGTLADMNYREAKRKAKRDELKKESRELMREIRQAKKEKEEEERRKTMLQEEAEAREKEEGPLADFRRERNALISQAKSHKSEGREDKRAMLARFREKLAKTRLEREENANEKSRGDETDDWMGHSLVDEEKRIVLAKDAAVVNEDTFDIFDPRNPINMRRRGADKAAQKKKK
ncbi:spliceosome-associated protein CWC27 homolog isoform X2 [Oscarella lobularis]|uniref:spliceosome-associated protein CWC27 homolog isoform X2 n=1 Tax=Oscarella lobularis TaxID=121494 RepID=UPI0033133899